MRQLFKYQDKILYKSKWNIVNYYVMRKGNKCLSYCAGKTGQNISNATIWLHTPDLSEFGFIHTDIESMCKICKSELSCEVEQHEFLSFQQFEILHHKLAITQSQDSKDLFIFTALTYKAHLLD